MEVQNSKTATGKGLFATKEYKIGEIVFILSGKLYDSPIRETIHIGNNTHIYDEFGIFINHSFTPNISINYLNVIALVDIFVGDELVFNYNETEIHMNSPFYVDNILVSGKTA
jgi:hypothetical protein